MVLVDCPACGSRQQVFDGVGGFRCKSCQWDVWLVRCHKCKTVEPFYGSAAGAGALVFRCSKCRAKNTIEKPALRAITAEAKRAERAEAARVREVAAVEKARRVQLAHSRQEEAARLNAGLDARLQGLREILVRAIEAEPMSFSHLKVRPETPAFEPNRGPVDSEPPTLEDFLPGPVKGLSGLMPGAKRKHQQRVAAAELEFELARESYQRAADERLEALSHARATWAERVAQIEEAARRQHADVDELEQRYREADPEAVCEYHAAVLASLPLPYDPPQDPRVAFSPASRQLVMELELPVVDAVPPVREHRYVKSRDSITTSPLPAAERKRIYAGVLAQTTLAAIDRVVRSDPYGVIETVVANGHVHTIDKRTGNPIHPCLITVRVTRERLGEINLAQVDPGECLKGLTASVSRSPAELVPVRPVVEFDMADPRFIADENVLATLDTRPNLMELTPKEFESLITNLFEKMGLETRQTQPSRDGGVDCVAYDSRPIFGGKVVIQAKRYKNTVGVSAVRDLFGTMQNEGATKGILVTTSGYGQASHEFSNGKPLELIDGGNLLYLLQHHAGLEAKIEPPEDWVDPEPEG